MKQDKNIGQQKHNILQHVPSSIEILQPVSSAIEKIKNASAQYEVFLVEKPFIIIKLTFIDICQSKRLEQD